MGIFRRLFSNHRTPANAAEEAAEADELTRDGALGPRMIGGVPQPFFPNVDKDPNVAAELRVAADQEDDNARSMLVERERREQERRD